jgi:phosphoglycerate dehydrogenase-like enzyme
MKIYIVLGAAEFNKKQMKELGKMGELYILDTNKISSQEAFSQISDADILLTAPSGFSEITSNMLKKMNKLKFISLLTVGYDWIDVKAAREIGIDISNARESNSEAVAEHIWGMILSLSKKIAEFDRDFRIKGETDVFKYEGFEVYGKTIGIIGLGDIGKRVARIARGFEMNIIGINKSKRRVPGVKLTTMTNLLKNSDIIAVSVPLTKDTTNMISSKQIGLMKKGVILVNCARENIVNKNAVISGIKKGVVFGYGVESELFKQLPKNDPYFQFSEIIINPHNAWNTCEAAQKEFDITISNIKAFLRGKPQNLVN